MPPHIWPKISSHFKFICRNIVFILSFVTAAADILAVMSSHAPYMCFQAGKVALQKNDTERDEEGDGGGGGGGGGGGVHHLQGGAWGGRASAGEHFSILWKFF